MDIKGLGIQVKMNLQEGDAGEGLMFRDASGFVNHLVSLLVPTEDGWSDALVSIEGFRGALVRENNEIKPAIEQLEKLERPLGLLKEGLVERLDVARRLDMAQGQLAFMVDGLTTKDGLLASKRLRKEQEAQVARQRQQALGEAVLQAKDRLRRLNVWVLRRQIKDKEAIASGVSSRIKVLDRTVKMARSGKSLLEIDAIQGLIKVDRTSLEHLDASESELRGEIGKLATTAIGGWLAVEEDLEKSIKVLRLHLTAEAEIRKARKAQISEKDRETGALNSDLKHLGEQIKAVEIAALDLTESGAIKSGESAAEAMERAGIELAVEDREQIALQARIKQLESTLDSSKDLLADKKSQRDLIDIRSAEIKKKLVGWRSMVTPVALSPWYSRLSEHDQVDDETDQLQLEMVMDLLPALLERGKSSQGELKQKYQGLRDSHNFKAKELQGIEQSGSMPLAEDALLVVDALSRSLDSKCVWLGSSYLTQLKTNQLKSEAQVLGALANLPGLGQGVVVQDALLGRVYDALSVSPLLLKTPVAVYSESMVRNGSAAGDGMCVVIGLGGAWWFNSEAFKQEVVQRKKALGDLSDAMTRTQESLSEVTQFVADVENIAKVWPTHPREIRLELEKILEQQSNLAEEIEEQSAQVTRFALARDNARVELGECRLKRDSASERKLKLELHWKAAVELPALKNGVSEAIRAMDYLNEVLLGLEKEDSASVQRMVEWQSELDGRISAKDEPLARIRQLKIYVDGDVAACAMEQAELLRVSEDFVARRQLLDLRTKEVTPQRDQYEISIQKRLSEIEDKQTEMVAILEGAAEEGEIRDLLAQEAVKRPVDAGNLASRMERERAGLYEQQRQVSGEVGELQGRIKATGLNLIEDPVILPASVESAQAEVAVVDAEVLRDEAQVAALQTQIDAIVESLEAIGQDEKRLSQAMGALRECLGKAEGATQRYAVAIRGLQSEEGEGNQSLRIAMEEAGWSDEEIDMGRLKVWAEDQRVVLEKDEKQAQRLERHRDNCKSDLMACLQDAVFTQNPSYMGLRNLIRGDVTEDPSMDPLDRDLAVIIKEVALHLEILREEIATKSETKRTILNSLESLGRMGVDWINGLNRLAVFPDEIEIPGLKGKAYLRIEAKPVPDSERLDLLERVLTQYFAMAKPGGSPDGLLLAQMVVREVARVKAVFMRHPNPNRISVSGRADGWEEIQTASTNSGGERLARIIMLYAVLSHLRGERQRRRHGGAPPASVLFMDNPFGALSRSLFIEQVRTVASGFGIQLLFTCGTQDAKALANFDHLLTIQPIGKVRTEASGEFVKMGVARVGRVEGLRNV